MIKLHYQDEQATIFQGDALEFMETLADCGATVWKVDCIVTDPPYGETALQWDKRVSGWMAAAARITNNLWCFGSFRMFMEMTLDGETGPWKLAQEVIWEKHNGSSMHADRFKRVHEIAAQFYQGEWSEIHKAPVMTNDATERRIHRKQKTAHWSKIGSKTFEAQEGGPKLMRSVVFVRSCHGYAQHPTQKPTAILEPLIRYSCPPGGIVFDPFMGSGSTLLAAKALGLRAVGCEIDPRHCDTAVSRLSQQVFTFSKEREEVTTP